MRHLAGLNVFRPPGDAGFAHTAFVSAPFAIAQRTSRTTGEPSREPRAVVAGEKDERVVVEFFFSQRLENLSDAPIEFFNSIPVKPRLLLPLNFPEAKSGTCG